MAMEPKQASPITKMDGTRLQSTPGPFWTSISTLGKGAFKYYVITFLTFLGPPTHLFDDLQYCKSSKIAIF